MVFWVRTVIKATKKVLHWRVYVPLLGYLGFRVSQDQAHNLREATTI